MGVSAGKVILHLLRTMRLLNKFLDLPFGQRAQELLMALLAVDGLFILLHVTHRALALPGDINFNLTQDQGYSEWFQYLKLLALAIGWGLIMVTKRSWIGLAWSALFLFVFLDDCFQLHEAAGLWLGNWFNIPAILYLRPRDVGEAIYFAVIGVALVGLMSWAYRVGRDRQVRSVSVRLFLLLLALGGCGVGADMVHSATSRMGFPSGTGALLEIIEDGGELLIVSAMVWFTYRLVTAIPQFVVDAVPSRHPSSER